LYSPLLDNRKSPFLSSLFMDKKFLLMVLKRKVIENPHISNISIIFISYLEKMRYNLMAPPFERAEIFPKSHSTLY
ncbi:hypothetical protein, partial [Cetobacterium sp.]|uniref:hypothetical protein n=1 Tax=Cetobacterium sp. TaxID=2071632 RepID=UPI003EE6F066